MSDREELAELILSEFRPPKESGQSWRLSPFTAADKILAAGYAKPRQITTVEELEALPVGSVVLVRGRAWTRFTPKQIHGGIVVIHKWMCPDGGFLRADSDQGIILPATVLYEPLP